MKVKRDLRRGLFRGAGALACLTPLGLAGLVSGDWGEVAQLASLVPTVLLGFVALSLLEGWGERLPRGRPAQRIGVLVGIALVATLAIPALIAQAAYLEGWTSGGGLGQVQRALVHVLSPPALLAFALFMGTPAALVALPRIRRDPEPSATVIALALLLSIPLLFLQEPCAYPIPAVLVGGWTLLYAVADGVEAFFFSPFEARAGELNQRVQRGDLELEAVELAARLGDGGAWRALRLPAETPPTPEEFAARLQGRELIGRASLLLAQLALPSARNSSQVRQALRTLAQYFQNPSPERFVELRDLWEQTPWVPSPEGSSSQRTLHFALSIALAPADAGQEVLQRSIQSAVSAALESSSPEELVSALREPLVAWLLDGRDPLGADI